MMPSLGQQLRSVAGIRLGVFDQHPAVPLSGLCLPPPATRPEHAPRIAVVTPSYNQGAYIGRTVESVLSQNAPGLEYVVQDAGSTDDTLRILAAFGDRLSIVSESDRGQADAINRGFARTDAPVMGWLNSDDLLLPGALARVAATFAAYPTVDVVYGNRLVLDEEDGVIGAWVLPDHDEAVLAHVDYIPQETLFWRRSAWKRTGGRIDTALDFAMDWDLILRFIHAKCRFMHIPEFLGAFRYHAAQKTATAFTVQGREEIGRLRDSCAPARRIGVNFAHARFLFRHRCAHASAWAAVAPEGLA